MDTSDARSVSISIYRSKEARPWSDLPSDLLTLIALRLTIIELLCFRRICKHWYAASLTASAQIESAPNQKPWLLLRGNGSKCLLYKESIGHYYLDIPEMSGATCIASYQGWLLLFRAASIFFLCPFSSAKIALPHFPHSQLSDHVAAFSSPPTSPDCIVSVIGRSDAMNLELHLLHRGDKKWTKYTLMYHINHFKTITCATYHNGDFYYLDTGTGALTFNVKNKSGTRYQVIRAKKGGNWLGSERCLPFSPCRDYFEQNKMKKLLGLTENVSITTCGTLVELDDLNCFIRNESIQSSQKSEDCIKLRGIWIHPRFFQIPCDQRW
ncbi:hypothetical protein CK203_002786 [Vitis vinifera]|uniref:Uncharacterized protein n=1 Tax=Vitis vinifera TaxID=29760 RepID=A0A438KH47_VITVI|nr:hypothetical protein CK203_002786 [Vitis vinifera]